mmetsp:Transcript_99417/g.259190  ORF Transcript_99417/g.259190 Transcript_99417/m.259190 type:complete len:241 (-) Transcript_99417:71-793(-)
MGPPALDTSNSGARSGPSPKWNSGYGGQLFSTTLPAGWSDRSWLTRIASALLYVSRSNWLSSCMLAPSMSGADMTAHSENWARDCCGVSTSLAPWLLPISMSGSFHPCGPWYSRSRAMICVASNTSAHRRTSADMRHMCPMCRPTGANQGCQPQMDWMTGRPLRFSALAIAKYFFTTSSRPDLGHDPDCGKPCMASPHSGSLQPSFFTKSTPHEANCSACSASWPRLDGLPAQVVSPRSV